MRAGIVPHSAWGEIETKHVPGGFPIHFDPIRDMQNIWQMNDMQIVGLLFMYDLFGWMPSRCGEGLGPILRGGLQV